jgi:hypothetical protein
MAWNYQCSKSGTIWLAPKNTTLLDKQTAPQLLENLLSLHETRWFITLCKNPPLFSILNQTNPVHDLRQNSDSCKMHLSSYLSLVISSSLFCFRLPYQSPVNIYFLLHTVKWPVHPASTAYNSVRSIIVQIHNVCTKQLWPFKSGRGFNHSKWKQRGLYPLSLLKDSSLSEE